MASFILFVIINPHLKTNLKFIRKWLIHRTMSSFGRVMINKTQVTLAIWTCYLNFKENSLFPKLMKTSAFVVSLMLFIKQVFIGRVLWNQCKLQSMEVINAHIDHLQEMLKALAFRNIINTSRIYNLSNEYIK